MPSTKPLDRHEKREREARIKQWSTYSGEMDLIEILAGAMEANCYDPMRTIWLSAASIEEEQAHWRCLRNNPEAAKNGIQAARRVVDKYCGKLPGDIRVEWPSLDMPLPSANQDEAA